MIRVKFYGIMKPYMPSVEEDGYWHLEKEGLTVGEILDETGASENEVAVTILVNRVRKDKSFVPQDGDILTGMPLVAGG